MAWGSVVCFSTGVSLPWPCENLPLGGAVGWAASNAHEAVTHVWVIALYFDARAALLLPVCCLTQSVCSGAFCSRCDWIVRRCLNAPQGGVILWTVTAESAHGHSTLVSTMSGTTSATTQSAKMRKDESFLGKLGGTLARKKKSKEGQSFLLFFLHHWTNGGLQSAHNWHLHTRLTGCFITNSIICVTVALICFC